MTSIATIQIFQGTHGIYYTYNGKNYDIHFPLEYALHTNSCSFCLAHGTYRGVFIGYCAKCIDEKMGKKFGNGFIGQGIERIDGDFPAWKTYLHHTKLDNIGCDTLVATKVKKNTDDMIWTEDELQFHDEKTNNLVLHNDVKCETIVEATVKCTDEMIWNENCDRLTATATAIATATKNSCNLDEDTLDELTEIDTNDGLVWIEDIQLWVKQERLSTLFSQMPQLVDTQQEIVPPAPVSPSIISIKERMQNSAMLCGNN
jgi:hypothetical protein